MNITAGAEHQTHVIAWHCVGHFLANQYIYMSWKPCLLFINTLFGVVVLTAALVTIWIVVHPSKGHAELTALLLFIKFHLPVRASCISSFHIAPLSSYWEKLSWCLIRWCSPHGRYMSDLCSLSTRLLYNTLRNCQCHSMLNQAWPSSLGVLCKRPHRPPEHHIV